MSRSGYSDDCDNLNLYRATVARAIRGKRGQKFLIELAKAMDQIPEKRLIRSELISESGQVCTIGTVCKLRGLDVSNIDVYDPKEVGDLVGIASQMAAEIEFENDEAGGSLETPEDRWIRMRKWVNENLRED